MQESRHVPKWNTLWLFNVAMVSMAHWNRWFSQLETTIHSGFSMAMLNNQMVSFKTCSPLLSTGKLAPAASTKTCAFCARGVWLGASLRFLHSQSRQGPGCVKQQFLPFNSWSFQCQHGCVWNWGIRVYPRSNDQNRENLWFRDSPMEFMINLCQGTITYPILRQTRNERHTQRPALWATLERLSFDLRRKRIGNGGIQVCFGQRWQWKVLCKWRLARLVIQSRVKNGKHVQTMGEIHGNSIAMFEFQSNPCRSMQIYTRIWCQGTLANLDMTPFIFF